MNIDYPSHISREAHLRHGALQPLNSENQVDLARVTAWFLSGLRATQLQPVLWLSALLLCADFITAARLLPVLRPLAVFLAPFFIGGVAIIQHAASNGQPLPLHKVFGTLVHKSNALCVIGLYGAAMVAIGHVIMLAACHLSLDTSLTTSGTRSLSFSYGNDHVSQGAIGSLFCAWIFAAAIASTCFAPALVLLADMSPHEATIASLHGAVRNLRVLVACFAGLTIAVLCAPFFPLPLRAFVLTPLLIAVPLLSLYGAFRDVFARWQPNGA